MRSWAKKPNYAEGTSEFACGITWLEETQLSNQPSQGCLKSKGVVAFFACVMEQFKSWYNFYLLGMIGLLESS